MHNISAWIKEHPKASIGIVFGLIAFILLIRAFSGGSSAAAPVVNSASNANANQAAELQYEEAALSASTSIQNNQIAANAQTGIAGLQAQTDQLSLNNDLAKTVSNNTTSQTVGLAQISAQQDTTNTANADGLQATLANINAQLGIVQSNNALSSYQIATAANVQGAEINAQNFATASAYNSLNYSITQNDQLAAAQSANMVSLANVLHGQ